MTLRSKYGQTLSKRTGQGSHLPEFELPRFESSRFDRLRRELIPPRFDLPKFENGFEPQTPDHPSVTRSTRAGQTNPGLNWFSLLEGEVRLRAEIRLSSAGPSSSSDETPLTEQQPSPLNKRDLSLPEFDRPKFESNDYARLIVEANRPRFDRPRFDEPDEV